MEMDLTAIGEQTVEMWDRSRRALKQLWDDNPLVLVFLRHYG